MHKRLSDSLSARSLTSPNYPIFPTDILPAQIQEKNLLQTLFGIESVYPEMSLDEFYSINSLNLRSDEFKQDHGDKQHILFAGCSHTFGQGNLLEDIWAYKLYNYLGGNDKNSGYFNVGRPGATYSEIARQVIAYVGLYGVPDKVFVLLPDLYREYVKVSAEVGERLEPLPDIIDNLDINFINSTVAGLLNAMILLLNSHGAKVYITSNNIYHCGIDNHCFLDPRDAISNFYPIDYELTEKRVYDYASTYKVAHSKFAMNAFDEMHDGYAFQNAWYNHFIDILEDRTQENEL